MVTKSIDQKKASFLTEIFMTCDTSKCIFPVLSTKTENMQSRQMQSYQTILPQHNACDVCAKRVRAYFCFNC
jgi:hypothetical protein